MDVTQLTGNITNLTVNTSEPTNIFTKRTAKDLVPYFVIVSCIGIFGTLGNLLFLLSFIREKRLRTVSNYLIGHLSLVDMLMCCLVIPWNMSVTSGTASIVSCQLATRIFSLFPHLSMQTQCLVSCNRYFLVTQPRFLYRKWFGRTYTLSYLLLGWLFALAVVILIACFGEKPVDVYLDYCDTSTDVTGSRQINYYVLCLLSLVYFVIALVFYGNLIWFVRRSPLPLDFVKKRDSKTSMALLFLLSIFAVSLLISPVGLYVNSLFKEKSNETSLNAVDQIITFILLMNYCINPVFYGFKIRYFKEAVKEMLFPCRSVGVVHPRSYGNHDPFVITPVEGTDFTNRRLRSRQQNT